MCFGIRISSPFDLNTLNIPIQNIKCPKNTKNHFLPSHYLWSLNCVVYAQACQTQSVWPAMLSMNHIVTQPSMLEGASKDAQSPSFTLSFFLSVQCFVLGYVIKDESDYRVLLFLLQSMKCAPMCFTYHLSIISELRASDWRVMGCKRWR